MKSFEEILELEQRGVMSFTGGGGKTSLMFNLARQLALSGKKVLTTTTTKIFAPATSHSASLLVHPDPEMILRRAATCLDATNHITAAAMHIPDTKKLKGFAPEAIRVLEESELFDWILVEADGSARRPLKAPAEHEPVIPGSTTILVAMAGLEVIGCPLSEELVFRSGLAGKLMKLADGETITASALARILAHPSGSFKDAPPKARRVIFLNKADTKQRMEAGDAVAAELRRTAPATAEWLMVGQLKEGIRIHSAHFIGTLP